MKSSRRCERGAVSQCTAHPRACERAGHTVRIIAAQFVKPYLRAQKNDYNDAQAIAEAVTRPRMRFVSVRSLEQQDLQVLHPI